MQRSRRSSILILSDSDSEEASPPAQQPAPRAKKQQRAKVKPGVREEVIQDPEQERLANVMSQILVSLREVADTVAKVGSGTQVPVCDESHHSTNID